MRRMKVHRALRTGQTGSTCPGMYTPSVRTTERRVRRRYRRPRALKRVPGDEMS